MKRTLFDESKIISINIEMQVKEYLFDERIKNN
jgi:hypothetical protein